MDTVMSVTACGKQSETAVNAIADEINRLDRLFSVQNKNSEIFRLNSEKQLNPSDETLELITRSIEISSMTDGAFDITTEPLSRIWGFYSGLENRVPSEKEIKAVLPSVGAEHIKIDGSTVSLDKSTSLDLGAIAKGYSSGRAAKILEENGISSALISLGGNVRAVGTKPDGSPWSVAVTDPDNSSEQIGVLSVKDRAVVTSGGYQRYFETNGKRYHHIIDAETGCPAQSGLKSVTIVSQDDTLADALSTAIFVMGLQKAETLYNDNNDLFGAVLITDSNEIYITENLKDSFSSYHSYEVIKA